MSKLRQLIRESITNYISEINEAGDISACESKILKTREAIELRKKKISKEGIDEAYYDIIDENKLKEFAKEIKILEKSLAKHEKMLEKLKSKANKGEKVEDTEKKEIVDEVTIDENEGMEYEGMSESLTPEEEEELDMIEDEMRYAVSSDSAGNPKMKERYDYLKSKRDEMDETMNESFLHMQKLAGVISETEYNEKVEEARFKKGTDIGKKGPGFEKIEKAAAKEYGSEEAGKRVAGSILKKVLKNK
jgi:hypothetical protein